MESTGHAQPSSTSLYDLILQALRARAKVMYSGESGAVVAPGINDDAATAEKPTYGLVKAAMSVVFDELPERSVRMPPAVAARPAPAAAGALCQWGHGAPR